MLMICLTPPANVTVNFPSSALPTLVKSRLAVPTTVLVVGFGSGIVGPGIRLVSIRATVLVAALDVHCGWNTYHFALPLAS